MSFLTGLMKALAGRAAAGPAQKDAPAPPATASGANAFDPGASDTARLPDLLAEARARVDADPTDGGAWLALASTLMRWGRGREALRAFRNAWERDRGSAQAALGLGVAAWEDGQRDEAERVLREACAVHPASPDLALALARMLVSSSRIDEARAIAERVRVLDPGSAAALATIARCDRRAGLDDAAERGLREAIAIDGSDPTLWEALSPVLAARGDVDGARDALVRAQSLADTRGIDLDTSLAQAELLRQRGDFAGATALVSAALRRRPDAAGDFMLAEALIAQGHYSAGWRRYEFRRFQPAMLEGRQHYGKPEWTGQDLAGRTILVEAEQGIGDVVWFARYLPLLGAMGARVVFLPRIDMMNVSRRLSGVDQVLVDGEPLPPFDFHVKLMSLAARFHTTLATVPGGVPYLVADTAHSERWAARLPADGRPRVGIVWAGKPAQPRDRFRSLILDQLLPVLRIPGVRFHSLQKGPAESQLADLPADVEFTALGAAFDDLEDLVAAIGEMDLVISVCTGPAHIAGAMGKPVWTLISEPPDLRWLTGREDSPWYPTMRLFRQRVPGCWDDVVERVAGELARGPAAWERLVAGGVARGPGSAPGAAQFAVDEDALDAGMAQLAETRQGLLMFDPGEAFAGPSIERYGEWLHGQLELALRLLAPGSVVVEAGAGAGAHAVALGRALGPDGLLFLYEGRAPIRRMLRQNLVANDVANAVLMTRALGAPTPEGFDADRETIDDLQLERLGGLKVDAPADPSAIVEGAQETLWRCRPWLMLAVPDDAALTRLGARVRELGYRTWRMETPMFSSSNFNRREDDVFGGRSALALVALPEEIDLRETPHGCVELH
ncbi:MAG: tetratricopeptide repeat protein [Betaproteobacteria bacterium]|nr:tetratricopeptide repeat protein [Betaproteobacteria bacterium]